MTTVQLARHAMATRFEILVCGENPVALRAAGEEALEEIERLEAQLSLFRTSSEIAHLNARAAHEPVRVTPGVFALLEHARRLTRETGGAFDITIAPLMRCWGFQGGSGHMPDAAQLAAARQCVGMDLVHLDPKTRTVQFERPGVMLDLGAIGKGYAIDRAVEFLRDAGVECALIHGGTSTVYGLGHPSEAEAWKVEIPSPTRMQVRTGEQFLLSVPTETSSQRDPLIASAQFAVVSLCDASLSVSAVWGKFFQANGRSFGHIIDPRSGQSADAAVLSAVVLPTATETDALSTALLTVGPAGHERIANLREGMRTLVVGQTAGGFDLRSRGIHATGNFPSPVAAAR